MGNRQVLVRWYGEFWSVNDCGVDELKKTLVLIIGVVVVAVVCVAAVLLWPHPTDNQQTTSGGQTATQTTSVKQTTSGEQTTSHDQGNGGPVPLKPVIYLYPQQTLDVDVTLDFDGVVGTTYPPYGDGWHVTAQPDGTLINHTDGRTYSYLFWDGHGSGSYDLTTGFVVSRESVAQFLQDKLAYMGLSPREYNEFIVYWLPQMQASPYYLISFQGDAYTSMARLTITPQPDCIQRVFMVAQPLDAPIDLPPQVLQPFSRHGFSVIEWGGDLLTNR